MKMVCGGGRTDFITKREGSGGRGREGRGREGRGGKGGKGGKGGRAYLLLKGEFIKNIEKNHRWALRGAPAGNTFDGQS